MKSAVRFFVLTEHAKPPPPRPSVALCMATIFFALLAAEGCRRTPSDTAAPAANAEGKTAQTRAVTLTLDEIEKAGIKTTPLVATAHAPESTGYAVVVTRETIAQALAELSTAAAAEQQSRAALARARSLSGTPGAMPIEALEADQRQATVDHAALVLAERRLSATYGHNAPWKDNYNSRELASLASGETKLARVTFPLGALGSSVPTKLTFARVGESNATQSIESIALWGAPADAAIPGNSFFAELPGNAVSEGERLLAHAPTGATETGIVVPLSAVVMVDGKYWCYVAEKPGLFIRTEIDDSMPTAIGYFVKGSVPAGAQVVTSSAGQLLAREINPSSAAE